MIGTIRRIDQSKGYGFLNANGKDYFFHRSGCIEPEFSMLDLGDEVQFDVNKNSPKGPRAENIIKLEKK